MITYNHEKFVKNALKGIFSQQINCPIELIIGDDASTDNTIRCINEFLEENPNKMIRVQVVDRSENIGVIPNFIDVLKRASGEYIAYCEGDDYWVDKNKLKNQFDFLENNSNYILCGSQVQYVDEHSVLDKMDTFPFEKYSKGKSIDFEDLCLSNQIPTVSFFFRNLINYLDLDLILKSPLGDWPLSISLGQLDCSKKFFVSDSKTAVYRSHVQGVYSMGSSEKKKMQTSKAIVVINKITKSFFSTYYYLLTLFLMKNNPLKDEFFKENYQNIDPNDEEVSMLKQIIENSSLYTYSSVFNAVFKKSKHKNQILQLYKECKPSLFVYLFPYSINWTIIKHKFFVRKFGNDLKKKKLRLLEKEILRL